MAAVTICSDFGAPPKSVSIVVVLSQRQHSVNVQYSIHVD